MSFLEVLRGVIPFLHGWGIVNTTDIGLAKSLGIEQSCGPQLVLKISIRALGFNLCFYDFGRNYVAVIKRGCEFVNGSQIKSIEETDAVHSGVEVRKKHGATGCKAIFLILKTAVRPRLVSGNAKLQTSRSKYRNES